MFGDFLGNALGMAFDGTGGLISHNNGSNLERFGFGNTGKTKQANEAIGNSKQALLDANNTNQGYMDDYENLMSQLYGSSPASYQKALENYLNRDEYSYNKDVNDFFSPAYEQRVKDAMNNITKSQANAGNMFSSDYLNSLNAKSQAMASEEWDKAYNRMLQDRQNALNEYQVNDSRLNNITTMLGNDTGKYADAMGNVYANRINANNALTQGLINLDTQMAQNNLNQKSGLQALLNPFG